jgi:hypothetical protein
MIVMRGLAKSSFSTLLLALAFVYTYGQSHESDAQQDRPVFDGPEAKVVTIKIKGTEPRPEFDGPDATTVELKRQTIVVRKVVFTGPEPQVIKIGKAEDDQ